jgi:hypothetical protein
MAPRFISLHGADACFSPQGRGAVCPPLAAGRGHSPPEDIYETKKTQGPRLGRVALHAIERDTRLVIRAHVGQGDLGHLLRDGFH